MFSTLGGRSSNPPHTIHILVYYYTFGIQSTQCLYFLTLRISAPTVRLFKLRLSDINTRVRVFTWNLNIINWLTQKLANWLMQELAN
jgi:hypothetical protein